MAEAQQPRVAEQQIVAHGENGKHHHPGHDAMVICRQHELQQEQSRYHRRMERVDAGRRAGPVHRGAVPKRPRGRKTRTMATSRVAIILASVGEKKTEMMPSERPISTAATT